MFTKSVPFEIPDGDTCKFPNGEPCIMFRWGKNKWSCTCRGWKGNFKIENFKRHKKCLLDTYPFLITPTREGLEKSKKS